MRKDAAKQGEQAGSGRTGNQTKISNLADRAGGAGSSHTDLSPDDFLTDEWPEKIGKDPKCLSIYEKTMCFHNLNAKGEATGVNDSRIYTYLTHTNHIFVCGGVPYIYRGGYYHMDLRGTIIKTLIRDCCLEVFVRSTTVDRIFKMFLQDYELEKQPEELNHFKHYFINFENGMYNAIQRRLYPHDPRYLCTNQIPHEYYPDGDHGSGTEMEKYLQFAIPDKDDREMLLEFIGLCCTKDTSQQKMLIMCGKGGTGKSTLINLIQTIVGRQNTSNVAMSDLSQRFTAISMMGKLLNACADLEIDALDDVTMIKKLIGEDSIKGEFKGKDPISFDNYAKMLFSTNELPIVRNEKTDGFYRRLLILTMDNKPKQRDPTFRKRLDGELPYLIHIAMQALRRMYMRKSIMESANSIERVQQLRNDSDTIEAFLSELCDVSDPNSRIAKTDLYKKYTEYCEENERQSHQKLGFYKALRNKGFAETKYNGDRAFRGIALKSDRPNETEFMTVPKNMDPDIPFDL